MMFLAEIVAKSRSTIFGYSDSNNTHSFSALWLSLIFCFIILPNLLFLDSRSFAHITITGVFRLIYIPQSHITMPAPHK